jgi:hypothetical protein
MSHAEMTPVPGAIFRESFFRLDMLARKLCR